MDENGLEFTSYRSQQVTKEELEELEALHAQNPDDIHVLDWLAFARYCTGSYARAVELYRRLIDREPQTASYYYFLGNSLYKTGERGEAIDQWEMAANLDTTGLFRKKAEERLAHAKSAKGASRPPKS